MTPRIALLVLVLAFPARTEEMVSPHGRTSACASCHDPAEEGARPEQIRFRDGSADASCKRCHAEDPHQTGLTAKEAQIPEHMLLVDEKLACLSCHDEPACDGEEPHPLDPHFLRGGPYERVGELCAVCHIVYGADRYDPHEGMARDPTDKEVCEHCHDVAPERDAETVDLKASGKNICLGCHTDMVHAGQRMHLGTIPREMEGRARAAGLPITPSHEIVCLTCHDPHPQGATARSDARAAHVGKDIFPDGWREQVLLPAIEERSGDLRARLDPVLVEPALLRLPLAGGALCQACHTIEGIEQKREVKP